MRIRLCIFAIGLLSVAQLGAQVKIGDNPQNIDAASILELESTTGALVITRVTTAQMNGITPLQGAVVYNTDENCVFYYEGTAWANLCEGSGTTNVSLELVDSNLILTDSAGNTVSAQLENILDVSIVSDPVEISPTNLVQTLTITRTGNEFNIQVAEIHGSQIADFTVTGQQIGPSTITQDKLAPQSVGQTELQQNAVADNEIDYDQVTLSDFTNDAGYVTNVELISPEPNNAIIDNNGAFYDDTPLQQSITTINNQLTQHLANDGDLDSDNERLSSITLSDNTLSFTEGASSTLDIDLGPALTGAGSDNQQLTLEQPGNLLTLQNGGTPISLDPFLDNTDDQQLSIVGNRISLTDGGFVDLPVAGGLPAITDSQIYVSDGADNPVGRTLSGDATINNTGVLDLADNAVEASEINADVAGDGLNQNASGALEIVPGTAVDQILKWNGANWALATDLMGGTTPTDTDANDGLSDFDPATGYNVNVDGTTVNIDGDAIEVADDGIGVDQINAAVAGDGLNQNASGALEIVPGTAVDQILKWNGANWALATDLMGGTTPTDTDANDGLSDFDPATGYNVNVDGTTVNIDGDAIEVADDGIGVDQINAAVAGDGLNQNASGALEIVPGTAVDQILKWNGANWALATDLMGGTTPTDTDANDGLSDFDPATGYNVNVDGTTVNIDGDAIEVADDGIGVDQINAAVAGDGLNQNASGALEIVPGTAVDQILKWDGTNWVLDVDNAGGAAPTDTDANDGLSDFDPATGYNVNVDGTTVNIDGDAIEVADDGIGVDQINAAVAGDGLNQNASGALEIIPGTAVDQILKWDGTNWVLDVDNAGGAAPTDTDANDGLSDFDPATGYNVNVDGTTVNIDGDAIEVADDGIGVDQINAAVAGDGLNQNASGALEIVPGTAVDQILKWNGANWALATDLMGGTTPTDTDANDGLSDFDPATGYNVNVDGTTVNIDGDAIEVADDGIGVDQINAAVAGDGLNQNASGALEIVPGTAVDQILKWNGANWALATDLMGGTTPTDTDANDGLSDFDPATGYNVNVDGTTVNIDGDAIEVADDGIGVDQINAAVAGDGLNQNASGALEIVPGTAVDQILKWDGTNWVLDVDNAGGAAPTDTDANDGLSDFDPATGYNVNVDGTTVNIDGDAIEVADDGIGVDQINAAVAGDGLNQNASGALEIVPGTAVDQILKWNGANWALATDLMGGTTPTDTDANDGLSDFDPATGYNVNVDGTTVNIDGDAIEVADDGIGVDQINAAVAGDGLNQNASGALEIIPGTAVDQILKWNGANWVLDVDNAGGAAPTDTDANDGLSDFDPATGYNVNVDGTTVNIDGDAIEVADDGIGVDQINAAVAGDGLNQNASGALEIIPGTAEDQILKWNNTTNTWELEISTPVPPAAPGSIYFAGGDGLITQNSAQFFWNNTDIRLGLGTNTPQTGLHIQRQQNNALFYGLQLQNQDGNDGGGSAAGMLFAVEGVGQFGKGALAYERTNGFGRGNFHILQNPDASATNPSLNDAVMTVTNAGDVGLGTTNPQGQLHVTRAAGNNLSYGLQLQNEDGTDGGGSATGMLFAVEDVGQYGKGALVYERTTGFARGDFHFLQDAAGDQDNPEITDAVMTIKNNGDVGLGTTTPQQRMHITNAPNGSVFDMQLQRTSGTVGETTGMLFSVEGAGQYGKGALIYERTTGFARGDFHFLQNADASTANPDLSDAVMTIKSDGDVGIGTITPAEMLHVAGNIRADGSFISNNTSIQVPDYVFQNYFDGYSNLNPTYSFSELSQVEAFIKKNKHLPGVTSAAEAKAKGRWNLSASNLQNLEKIEELFLHTIAQEKKINALESQNKALTNELETLKSDMALIKKMLLENKKSN